MRERKRSLTREFGFVPRRGLLLALLVFLPAAGLLAAPDDQPDEPMYPPGRLVRLNIVALDNHDQTVRDLGSGDFRVLDHGKPRKIVVFRRNERRLQAPEHLAPNTFSNRSAAGPRHATVILFDLLNDHLASRGYAAHEITESLERIEQSDNIYLYLLTMRGVLYPVRGLPNSEGDVPGDGKGWARQIRPLLDRALRDTLRTRPVEMLYDVDYRIRTTYTALADLSAAVAAIPGRKSIVWITHGIPIEIGPRRSGTGDWIDYSPYLQRLTAAFDEANIAIYPVVLSPPGMSGSSGPEGANPARGISSLDTLQQFADLTGGRTYMEDVRAAITEGVDEARVGYLIEYDPSPQKWDSKYHKIRVTCTRPGVRIQTKKGYYAFPQMTLTEDQQLAALESAAASPFDAGEIGLRVTVSPSPAGPKARRLQIRFSGPDLLWLREGDRYTADVQAVFAESGGQGPPAMTKPIPLSLSVPAAQRETAMKGGVSVSQDVPLRDGARGIKVIMLDRGTSAIGSVTVPLAATAAAAPGH
jgi:VWFA-related protein